MLYKFDISTLQGRAVHIAKEFIDSGEAYIVYLILTGIGIPLKNFLEVYSIEIKEEDSIIRVLIDDIQ